MAGDLTKGVQNMNYNSNGRSAVPLAHLMLQVGVKHFLLQYLDWVFLHQANRDDAVYSD